MSTPPDPVALLGRQARLRRLVAALDDLPLATAPWWQPGRRRAAVQEMETRRTVRAKRAAELDSLGPLTNEAETVAKECIDVAWKAHRNDGTVRGGIPMLWMRWTTSPWPPQRCA